MAIHCAIGAVGAYRQIAVKTFPDKLAYATQMVKNTVADSMWNDHVLAQQGNTPLEKLINTLTNFQHQSPANASHLNQKKDDHVYFTWDVRGGNVILTYYV